MMAVQAPAVVLGMSDEEYHSSSALSSTGIRYLLDSPARFKHWQEHPEPPKKEFDLGHAVHAKVLGVGAPWVGIPEELLGANGAINTKAAKEFVAQARAKGQVPLKAEVVAQVDAMAEAFLAFRPARKLAEQPGATEVSVFARDPEYGFECRARFDFLPSAPDGEVWDLKTTGRRASLQAFMNAAADHGYHVQQAWYQRVHEWATGEAFPFLFVVIETAPPYLLATYRLDREFEELARKDVDKARALYAECLAADEWRGYAEAVVLVPPPMRLVYAAADEENALSEVTF